MAPEIIDVDAFDGPDLQITGQYRPKRVQSKAPVRTQDVSPNCQFISIAEAGQAT